MERLTTKEIFAQRLKEQREKKGQTQAQFARSLSELYGISTSRGSISFYEMAERTADIEFVAAVAKYCNVSTDFLLGLSQVKSQDLEIKQICDRLGLSEKSFNFLKELREAEIIEKKLESLDATPQKNAPVSHSEAVNLMIEGLISFFDAVENIVELVGFGRYYIDSDSPKAYDMLTEEQSSILRMLEEKGFCFATPSDRMQFLASGAKESMNVLIDTIWMRNSSKESVINAYLKRLSLVQSRRYDKWLDSVEEKRMELEDMQCEE